MAKNKSNASFSMAEEIRTALTDNSSLTQRDAMDVIKKKYPDATINDNSFGVAFYNARKKLGIPSPGGKKKSKVSVKKPRATATATTTPAAASTSRSSVELSILQAAAKFLSTAGSIEVAMEGLKQVQLLQIKQ